MKLDLLEQAKFRAIFSGRTTILYVISPKNSTPGGTIHRQAKPQHDATSRLRISGKTPISERKLQQLIDSMEKGDILIVSELSRLGRNMIEVMIVLELLIKKGCRVHSIKGGYRLDDSLPSEIISMVLVMAAEIERELISQRTKEALARRKAEGKPLARPKGSYGVSKLDQHEDDIRRLLSHGVAKAAIARMHGCSWQTVHNWVKRNA